VAFAANDSRLITSSNNTLLLWDTTDTARPPVLMKKSAVAPFYLATYNCLYLLETRENPVLCGLKVLKLRDEGSFDTRVICWFPPDLSPRHLAVDPATLTAVVGCGDGRARMACTSITRLT
jgi:hypothetical protein